VNDYKIAGGEEGDRKHAITWFIWGDISLGLGFENESELGVKDSHSKGRERLSGEVQTVTSWESAWLLDLHALSLGTRLTQGQQKHIAFYVPGRPGKLGLEKKSNSSRLKGD